MEVTCRSCGSTALSPVLSLGNTPLANSLLTADDLGRPEPVYPLDVVFCRDCSLVQLTETVAPEKLFSEYLYFSSFSDTMLQSAHGLVQHLVQTRRLDENSLVMEIASNDGYLLQYYRAAGVPVLGIEPARNIACVAEERGISTLCAFFNKALGVQLAHEGRRADVVHANNVLAHVADLNGVVAGISAILKDDGVAIVEVPYAKELIDRVEFDTIYHEHLCYFSLTALVRLFRRHGLEVVDVERLSIHGGSLRVFLSISGLPSVAVQALLNEEKSWGVDSEGYYVTFAQKVSRLRDSLLALLHELRTEGRRIAAYGASAKGSTLLNYCGIGQETLEFVVDRSTVKQGRYTPGTHLAICPPQRLLETMPDYALLLAWNFADEILAQQNEYLLRGGHFIVPVPKVRVV